MRRKLYGTNKLVDDFTKTLIQLETLDGGWTKKFIDKEKNETWMRYTIDIDNGHFWNLILITPKPNTDELIRIALESEFNDEIHASSTRLFLEEQSDGFEYRQKLIDKIGEFDLGRLPSKQKERIKTIIKSARLNSEFNYRSTMRKPFAEVKQDWAFVKQIADKSKKILKQIEG